MTKNQQNFGGLLPTAYCLLLISLLGCVSLSPKEDTLAVVDGESISKRDLEYSLQIAHRREDLSSARKLNISQYVQKLVDDKLIMQEAKLMGMEEYPEVQKKLHVYILRESVTRLYNEEIVQKVSVTEADILAFYKKNYELFTLGIIEVNSENEAKEILEKLKKGHDFKKLARKYSTHFSKKNDGKVTLTRKAMDTFMEEAISGLNPTEFSNIKKRRQKYYIVKLISRKEAPDEDLYTVRNKIKSSVNFQKIKERSDEYVAKLRSQASIKIDQELLLSIHLNGGKGEREKWSKDGSPLVTVNDSILTVREFVSMLPSNNSESKEKILNRWLERKLVDIEALGRHYEIKTDLKGMVQRYKNQILKDTFIKKVITPRIQISDQDLEDHYLRHQKDFTRPVSYKVQQITVKTREEAEEVLKSLHGGANFSWLAKKKSIDSAASMGGVIGWVIREKLSEPAGEIIDTLKPGEISPILKIGSLYRIIRLQEKTQEEIEEFSKVKALVHKKLSREKFNELYSGYVDKLRKEAQITIYSEAIESFEKMLRK